MRHSNGPGLLSPVILALALWCAPPTALIAGEDLAGTAPPKPIEPPAAHFLLATNVEAEIAQTRQALDQLRREFEKSSTRQADAIASSLKLVESTLSRMHERQMEISQNSNRITLIVAGVFATVGFLCLLVTALVLMRAINRFSDLAATAPQRAQLPAPPQPVAALGTGEVTPSRTGAAEEASSRFQSALEQLQKRILELEHSAQAGPPGAATPRGNAAVDSAPTNTPAITVGPLVATVDIQPLLPDDEPTSKTANDDTSPASRASVLLGKGQALLNLDSAESALRCFDEALALEPNNAEALVKRGMAFEKLQDWEQALESYDRAIAADRSITVAYLYRGGVCNRLQRYREALESYEQALQTEKKSQAS